MQKFSIGKISGKLLGQSCILVMLAIKPLNTILSCMVGSSVSLATAHLERASTPSTLLLPHKTVRHLFRDHSLHLRKTKSVLFLTAIYERFSSRLVTLVNVRLQRLKEHMIKKTRFFVPGYKIGPDLKLLITRSLGGLTGCFQVRGHELSSVAMKHNTK